MRNEGIALVTTLTVLTLILAVLAVAYQIMVGATQNIQDRNVTVQAQYAAEAGLNLAKARVQTTYRLLSGMTVPNNKDSTHVTTALRNTCGRILNYGVNDGTDTCTLNSTNIDLLIRDFLTQSDFIPTSKYAEVAITNPTTFWQSVLKQNTLTTTSTIGSRTYTVTVTNPIAITRIQRVAFDAFEFHFDFADSQSVAVAGNSTNPTAKRAYSWDRIMNPADQKVTLMSPSFSRWALFTDAQGSVYFDAQTNFGGPVHTNGIFNFGGNSTFTGEVTSAGCDNSNPRVCRPRAVFETFTQSGGLPYLFDPARGDKGFRCANNACTSVTSSSLRGTIQNPYFNSSNRPNFQKGARWGTEQIPLPSSSNQKTLALQSGIYIPNNAESITLSISGDAQIIRVCNPPNTAYSGAAEKNTDCQEFRIGPNKVLTMKSGNSYVNAALNPNTNKYQPTTTPVTFNGTLYVDGNIARLRGNGNINTPDISKNAQLTISSKSNTRITDSLTLEDPPCTVTNNQGGANCDNLNAINVLGLYSEAGNIEFGFMNSANLNLNAPSKIDLHASVMTAQGSFEVENFDKGSLQDYITVLGSVIQKQYGAFRRSGTSGYYRNFVYDKRMESTFTPPNFPKALNTWLTFSAGDSPKGLWRLE